MLLLKMKTSYYLMIKFRTKKILKRMKKFKNKKKCFQKS